MIKPQAVWQVTEIDERVCERLAERLGVSPLLARLLCNRGMDNEQKAREFLACDFAKLTDPFCLKDMAVAVEEIFRAVEQNEKIMVYGDYDVDGVTSTTLLLDAFACLGYEAAYYIPDRLEEGYGLNKEALTKISAQGYKLVVTVDCGISALAEAEYAGELGLRLIITDHHEPSAELPKALAVINPKQNTCSYPFKDLAGVGVAFKLAQALFKSAPKPLSPSKLETLLDLVTLGTIADMVPLIGENRTLVKQGLQLIAASERIGIKCLIEVSGLGDKEIGPGQVGFGLAPRINATGRIGDAAIAVQLLRTNDWLRAREMAEYLEAENQARQELETSILDGALEMLEDFNPDKDKVIVLARENWHPGVIGIVASRLVERFYRPVILIALDGEEGKGSGRSIAGFNLHEALTDCGGLLLRFGGHKQAAGLAISRDTIDLFRKQINDLASREDEKIYIPRLYIDAVVDLEELTFDRVEELQQLGPYGIGNPGPVLTAGQLSLIEAREVGKEKTHLKVRVKGNGKALNGIGFNLAGYLQFINIDQPVEVAFTPEFNEYKGRVSVQLHLKDLRNCVSSGLAVEKVIQDNYLKRLTLSEKSALATLAQGQNPSLEGKVSYLLPILAAINQAAVTRLTSMVLYPLPALAERMRLFCRRLAPQGLDIIFATPESLLQDLARIEGIKLPVGLIVLDSVRNWNPPSELIGPQTRVLNTFTAKQLVEIYAPPRERLARLYQALRDLASPNGSLGPESHSLLAGSLGESTEFVENGLEIFQELKIIDRKNEEKKRIIYFHAPKEKLNLASSQSFLAGQALAKEFARVDVAG